MSSQTVLFDAPGPRARVRHRLLTVVGVALLTAALWVAVTRLADKGQLDAAKWTPFLTAEAWVEYLLVGLWGTIKAALISVVLAGVFGIVFGLGRLSEEHVSQVESYGDEVLPRRQSWGVAGRSRDVSSTAHDVCAT